MKLYTLDNKYIELLSEIENKIAYNKSNGSRSRPYIGVVLEINNLKYFAPMSSKDMRNNRSNYTFHVLSKEQNLGVIHLNNMIPVPDERFLQEIDWKNIVNEKYQNLIKIQIGVIRRKQFRNEVINKALNLYQIVTDSENQTTNALFLKKLSNNFKELELHCITYRESNTSKKTKSDPEISFDL